MLTLSRAIIQPPTVYIVVYFSGATGATVIFLGPPVTQQRRYEWQRSLSTQTVYIMVDSVITHANKTVSTVYWKCLLCSSL